MFDYAGNPNNYPLAISIPDDSDEPNATNFAVPWEGLADRTASLYAQQGHIQALNWSQEFQESSTVSQQAIAFDPLDQVWMLLEVTAGGESVLTVSPGLDLGASAAWSAIGGGFVPAATAVYSACCADPTTAGHYWVTLTDSVGPPNNHFKIYKWNGSTWSGSPGGWTSSTATGQYYGVELATLGGYVIAAVSGTDSGDSFIVSSNNGFTTWSTLTGIPGTGITYGVWYLKSNQGLPGATTPACVAIQGLGGGTENLFDVYSTTDGHTWTTSTQLAAIAPVDGVVVGLAWTVAADGPCWVVAIETVSAHVVFFRSQDGIAWTPQTGGIGSQQALCDMASVGGALVCTTDDESSGGPSGTIFSIDGGVTWYPGPAGFTSNITGPTRSRIVASNTGFMMANGKFARFSSLAGLPVASL